MKHSVHGMRFATVASPPTMPHLACTIWHAPLSRSIAVFSPAKHPAQPALRPAMNDSPGAVHKSEVISVYTKQSSWPLAQSSTMQWLG